MLLLCLKKGSRVFSNNGQNTFLDQFSILLSISILDRACRLSIFVGLTEAEIKASFDTVEGYPISWCGNFSHPVLYCVGFTRPLAHTTHISGFRDNMAFGTSVNCSTKGKRSRRRRRRRRNCRHPRRPPGLLISNMRTSCEVKVSLRSAQSKKGDSITLTNYVSLSLLCPFPTTSGDRSLDRLKSLHYHCAYVTEQMIMLMIMMMQWKWAGLTILRISRLTLRISNDMSTIPSKQRAN